MNVNQVGFGGSLSSNVGNGAGAIYNRGTLNVRGGAAVTNFAIGNGVGGYGYYLHDTATTTTVNEAGVGGAGNGNNGGGNGVLEVRGGGTFTTNAWLTVNRTNATANAASSMILLNNGTLVPTNVAGQFQVNSNTNLAVLYATLDVGTGGKILGGNTGNINLNQQGNAGNQGTLSIHDGGSVQTTGIFAGNATGTATVNLNGGTLVAANNGTLLGANLDGVVVYPNGATINTNGFNTTTGVNALAAPLGNGLPATIPVATAGAGYIGRPVVNITDATGTGATAVANFDEATGVLTGITVTSPGSNYSAPTFTLVGGGFTTAATVGAVALTPNSTTGGLTKTGAGTLTLGSANSSYGGPTILSGGTVAIGSVGNAGGNSALGASSTAAANLVFDGGTLQYTGGSNSTDRDFTIISGKTAVIDVSTATTRLTLAGSSAATNGSLTKTGNGTLELIGVNNFHTGTTSVNGGVLSATGSYPGGFAVNSNGHLAEFAFSESTLTVPTLALNAGCFVDFELGFSADLNSSHDIFSIANAGGLSLTSTALNLYQTGGTSPFTTNGTYTLFDYHTTFTGSLTGAFIIANSQVGKIYSIANNTTATTIELTINDAVSAMWNVDGGGSWNTAVNWLPVGVPNSNGAFVTFGSALFTPGNAPANIAVTGPKTVGSMVFDNTTGPISYNLTGGAADTITLNNGLAIPTISVISGNHTIAAPMILAQNTNIAPTFGTMLTISGNIAGAGTGLSITDTGTVVLSGANTYTGVTSINAGTLEIVSGASLGSSSGLVEKNGALFRINAAGATTITQPVTLDLAGGTAVQVNGGGSGVGNFAIEISPGTFATLSGAVSNPGGSLVIRGGGGLSLTNPGASVLSTVGGLGTVLQDGTLTLHGGASATYAVAGGELTIGDNTPNQVSLTLASGTLNVGTFTSVGRGNGTGGLQSSLNVTGGILNTGNLFTGFANGVGGYNAVPTINLSGSGQVNATNSAANTGVRLGESAGATSLLNLSNTATLSTNGDFQIGFGGNAIITVANSAIVNIPRLGLGYGTNGAGNIGAGVVRQTGGIVQQAGGFAGDWRIGGINGANDALVYGSYEISAGVLTTNRNFQIGANGRGVMDISGTGSVTDSAGFPVVGRFAGGNGLLNIKGGSFNNTNATNFLIIGEAGNGVVNVGGSGALNVLAAPGAAGSGGGTGGIRLGHAAGGAGELNLNGGTVIATGLAKSALSGSTGIVYFNGGTLKASATNATFLQGLDAAIVGPGGAKFDTNGNDITIAQDLRKPVHQGVRSIAVLDGGSGWIGQPIVQILGDGIGATAVANVDGAGVVTSITITNPGIGYVSAPTVNLLGNGTAIPVTLDTPVVGNNDQSGGVTKNGAGTLTLTGAQDYAFLTTNAGRTNLNATLADASIHNVGGILNVNADATNSDVTVGGTTVFTVSQTLDSLVIGDGGVAIIGGPAAGPVAFTAPEFDEISGVAFASVSAAQAVPEPGTAALIFAGLAGLLGRRRRG